MQKKTKTKIKVMVGAIELIEDLMENQNSFYLVPTDIIKRLIKQGKEIIKEIE